MAPIFNTILKAFGVKVGNEFQSQNGVSGKTPSIQCGSSPVYTPPVLQTVEEEEDLYTCCLYKFIDVTNVYLMKQIDESGLFEKQNKRMVYNIYSILLDQSNREEYKLTEKETIDKLIFYTGIGLSLLLDIEKDEDFRVVDALKIWKQYHSDVKFDIATFKELIISNLSDMNYISLKGTPMTIYILEILRVIRDPNRYLYNFTSLF